VHVPRRRRPVEEATALVDIEAVARLLGVSVRYVRRMVFEKRIPYVKVGRLLRFDMHEVAGFVEANKVPAHDTVLGDHSAAQDRHDVRQADRF
jgi:excisionase family DNA binding protein